MTEAIKQLLERVERATGPDRELDRAILTALELVSHETDPITGCEDWNHLAGKIYSHPAPITASIDAALALVEKVAPLCDFYVEVEQVSGGFCQYIFLGAGGGIAPTRERHKGGRFYEGRDGWKKAKDNLPLAILTALLRSLANGER